jgi:hypothetical protein
MAFSYAHLVRILLFMLQAVYKKITKCYGATKYIMINICMKNFFIWMQKDEGWKAMLAFVYAGICLFDFVVVPAWIGITRPPLEVMATFDIEFVKTVYTQHEPFTLQGGGLFHLAFGALLTGSALTRPSAK